jgi:hypothetical protein
MFISIYVVEVCDARDDDISTQAGNTINQLTSIKNLSNIGSITDLSSPFRGTGVLYFIFS